MENLGFSDYTSEMAQRYPARRGGSFMSRVRHYRPYVRPTSDIKKQEIPVRLLYLDYDL